VGAAAGAADPPSDGRLLKQNRRSIQVVQV
jgi:hypothetical protein